VISVRLYDRAADFHAQADQFLLAREAEHNLLIGLASRVGSRDWAPGETLLAAVVRGDRPVLVGVRAGFHLVLSESEDPDAVRPLADAVHTSLGTLSGVNGPNAVVRRFVDAWIAVTDAQAHLAMAQRIYRASSVRNPDAVAGLMRTATLADRDLLIEWVGAFHVEATQGPAMESAVDNVDRRLSDGQGGVVLWERDGRPVSMAAVTGPTPNGIRVGLVYTPPRARDRGYASALVAALTQRELEGGRQFCFLYTDLANPTSNKIYQRIGYEPVTDAEVHVFDSPR